MLLHESFTNKFADEVEELEMISLDDGLRIREVCGASGCFQEQGQVFIKHMLAQESEPFFSQASFIYTSFILERYAKWSSPLVSLLLAHQGKRVVKGLLTSHKDVPCVVLLLCLCLLEHDAPYQALRIELKDLWDLDHEIFELHIDHLLVDTDEDVDQLLVADKEAYYRSHTLVKLKLR